MSEEKFPIGFLEKYSKMLSKKDFEEFLDYSGRALRKSIRVNTLKISVQEFLKLATEKGWELTPIPWCESGFWIDRENREVALGNTLEHALGLFFIQEASSMLPVEVLGAGSMVLDMCSAPGSKSTHMASLMKNQGFLLANDFSATRLKKLAFNLLRLGVFNAVITNGSGEVFAEKTLEKFDKILIDAPCTGEGTCRKDKDALKSWSQKKIESAAILQKKLIEAGFLALESGGELVYSTCTLGVEENEEVVDFLIKKYLEAELINITDNFQGAQKAKALDGKSLRVWPQLFDCEGFFVAKIRKNSEKTENRRKKRVIFKKLKPLSREKFKIIQKFFEKEFDFDIFSLRDRFFIHHDQKTVFVLPENFDLEINFDRAGFVLCEIHGAEVRIMQEGAIFLAEKTKGGRIVSINREQAVRFFAGEDFDLSEFNLSVKNGQIIFAYQKWAVGTAKIVGKNLKNLLPRNFVCSGLF